ncbi:gremlin-1-like [Sceloporus undulatus]|uniref:gremlin-1-like n=1 Tax=Sceloporus undulatus TaxID=8520 RepID=UPI001C4B991E|nr:gremlin-1-like [Sceloporus undulatus]
MDCKFSPVGILVLLGLLLHMLEIHSIQASHGHISGKDLDKKMANDSEQAQQCLNSKFRDMGNIPCDEVTESSTDTLHITEKKLVQDWCKMQEFKQTIHEEGCNNYTFTNRFCYGQCNSFYIPWHNSDERGVFQACSFCKPKKITTTSVILNCPDLLPPRKKKKIRQVEECRCMIVNLD